ncbi:hypothetical protein GBAR_LOCUS13753, partial [Geodia barretti]
MVLTTTVALSLEKGQVKMHILHPVCSGTEYKFSDCKEVRISSHCYYSEVWSVTCGIDNCLDEDKELDEAEEQVEICSDGEWQAVCGNGW